VSLVNRSAGIAALTLAGVLVAGGTAAALNSSVLTAALPGGVGNADSFPFGTDPVTPTPGNDEPTPAGVALTPSPESSSDASGGDVAAGQGTGQQVPGAASPSVRRTSTSTSRTTTGVRPARVSGSRPTHTPSHRPSPSASPRHSESESPEPHPSESHPNEPHPTPSPSKPADD
jgi:hypothetical protein